MSWYSTASLGMKKRSCVGWLYWSGALSVTTFPSTLSMGTISAVSPSPTWAWPPKPRLEFTETHMSPACAGAERYVVRFEPRRGSAATTVQ